MNFPCLLGCVRFLEGTYIHTRIQLIKHHPPKKKKNTRSWVVFLYSNIFWEVARNIISYYIILALLGTHNPPSSGTFEDDVFFSNVSSLEGMYFRVTLNTENNIIHNAYGMIWGFEGGNHVRQGLNSFVLGLVIPPLIGNPYNGYINPYYWVNDHPLLYGNDGSLETGSSTSQPFFCTNSMLKVRMKRLCQ